MPNYREISHIIPREAQEDLSKECIPFDLMRQELQEQEDHFGMDSGASLLGIESLSGSLLVKFNQALQTAIDRYFPEESLGVALSVGGLDTPPTIFVPDDLLKDRFKKIPNEVWEEILATVYPLIMETAYVKAKGAGNLTVPGLGTFHTLVKQSDFAEQSEEIMLALYLFQAKLYKSFTKEDLLGLSPTLSQLKPRLCRDNYRFFFNVSKTEDGGLIVTVFLEAADDELKGRPATYVNSNKHLHHAFITSDGIIKKSPGAFKRDRGIADRSEHTAYAKFYLRGWGGKPTPGTSMLIHPMQRARLTYEPNLDKNYSKYKRDLHELYKLIRIQTERMIHKNGVAENDSRVIALNQIAKSTFQIFEAAFTQKFEELLRQEGEKIQNALKFIPNREEFDVHRSEKVNCQRHHSSIRREVNAMLRRSWQVLQMYKKKAEGHEANDEAADRLSGQDREFSFLAISEILKSCVEQCTGAPVYRFMLSSKQMMNIRLTSKLKDDIELRHRISRVPLAIERDAAVVTTNYPLRRVMPDGHISQRLGGQSVITVCLDHKSGEV